MRPDQYSLERMRAAKKLFLRKKNRSEPVSGDQAVSGREDSQMELPEQQQTAVSIFQVRFLCWCNKKWDPI